MKIAGQIHDPHSNNAANAIPVGGHTGVALGFTNAETKAELTAYVINDDEPDRKEGGMCPG